MNSFVRKSNLLIPDIVLLGALFCAYLLRFEKVIGYYFTQYNDIILYIIGIYVLVNWLFGLYNKIWRYASIQELLSVFCTSSVSCILCYLMFWRISAKVPSSAMLITWILSILLIGGTRFTYRIFRDYLTKSRNNHDVKLGKRLMIIGGGSIGSEVVRQLVKCEPREEY